MPVTYVTAFAHIHCVITEVCVPHAVAQMVTKTVTPRGPPHSNQEPIHQTLLPQALLLPTTQLPSIISTLTWGFFGLLTDIMINLKWAFTGETTQDTQTG